MDSQNLCLIKTAQIPSLIDPGINKAMDAANQAKEKAISHIIDLFSGPYGRLLGSIGDITSIINNKYKTEGADAGGNYLKNITIALEDTLFELKEIAAALNMLGNPITVDDFIKYAQKSGLLPSSFIDDSQRMAIGQNKLGSILSTAAMSALRVRESDALAPIQLVLILHVHIGRDPEKNKKFLSFLGDNSLWGLDPFSAFMALRKTKADATVIRDILGGLVTRILFLHGDESAIRFIEEIKTFFAPLDSEFEKELFKSVQSAQITMSQAQSEIAFIQEGMFKMQVAQFNEWITNYAPELQNYMKHYAPFDLSSMMQFFFTALAAQALATATMKQGDTNIETPQNTTRRGSVNRTTLQKKAQNPPAVPSGVQSTTPPSSNNILETGLDIFGSLTAYLTGLTDVATNIVKQYSKHINQANGNIANINLQEFKKNMDSLWQSIPEAFVSAIDAFGQTSKVGLNVVKDMNKYFNSALNEYAQAHKSMSPQQIANYITDGVRMNPDGTYSGVDLKAKIIGDIYGIVYRKIRDNISQGAVNTRLDEKNNKQIETELGKQFEQMFGDWVGVLNALKQQYGNIQELISASYNIAGTAMLSKTHNIQTDRSALLPMAISKSLKAFIRYSQIMMTQDPRFKAAVASVARYLKTVPVNKNNNDVYNMLGEFSQTKASSDLIIAMQNVMYAMIDEERILLENDIRKLDKYINAMQARIKTVTEGAITTQYSGLWGPTALVLSTVRLLQQKAQAFDDFGTKAETTIFNNYVSFLKRMKAVPGYSVILNVSSIDFNEVVNRARDIIKDEVVQQAVSEKEDALKEANMLMGQYTVMR